MNVGKCHYLWRLLLQSKSSKDSYYSQNINKSLLNDKGLSIGKFTQKVKGKNPTWRDPKTKWTISKNKGQPHGGSYWKLINNKGKKNSFFN